MDTLVSALQNLPFLPFVVMLRRTHLHGAVESIRNKPRCFASLFTALTQMAFFPGPDRST